MRPVSAGRADDAAYPPAPLLRVCSSSNVKHVWSVEVAPICRGDLIRLPHKSPGAGALAGGSRLALVAGVGGSLHLIDPMQGKRIELSSEAYWRHPFMPLLTRGQLSTFVVLDVEIDDDVGSGGGGGGGSGGGGGGGGGGSGSGADGGDASDGVSTCHGGGGAVGSGRGIGLSTTTMIQADATVAREADFGSNDTTHYVRTHLGGVLEAGDEASGYDLEGLTSFGDDDDAADVPQAVILVEKKKLRQTGSHAKRGSGAARRRKKKGGSGGEDGSSSMCSGTTYQSEYSDLDGLDALAISLHEEGDDDDEAQHAFAPALRGFLGEIEEGDEAEEEEAESQRHMAIHESVAAVTEAPPSH